MNIKHQKRLPSVCIHIHIATQQHLYTLAVVTVETCCPFVLVTTLLLVDEHSTILNVVTGLVVVWLSLTIDTKLLGCNATVMFCCLGGEQLDIDTEYDFGTTVGVTPIYMCRNWNTVHMHMYTQNAI